MRNVFRRHAINDYADAKNEEAIAIFFKLLLHIYLKCHHRYHANSLSWTVITFRSYGCKKFFSVFKLLKSQPGLVWTHMDTKDITYILVHTFRLSKKKSQHSNFPIEISSSKFFDRPIKCTVSLVSQKLPQGIISFISSHFACV